MLPIVLFSCTSQIQAQSKILQVQPLQRVYGWRRFAGKYSSEEISPMILKNGAKIIFSNFDILDKPELKVEGTARYNTYGAKAKSVTLFSQKGM